MYMITKAAFAVVFIAVDALLRDRVQHYNGGAHGDDAQKSLDY